jgi:hypothetical protein
MSVARQLRPVLTSSIHLVGFSFCIASILWLPNITNPLHKGVGGSCQFLTIIALLMATLTFFVGLLGDIYSNRQLSAFRYALSVCATPLEVLIGIGYWGIYAIDKTKVTPPGHGIALLPNLGLHAVPAVMLTLDMLTGPAWPIKTSTVVFLDTAFFLLYWAWLEYCFSYNKW